MGTSDSRLVAFLLVKDPPYRQQILKPRVAMVQINIFEEL